MYRIRLAQHRGRWAAEIQRTTGGHWQGDPRWSVKTFSARYKAAASVKKITRQFAIAAGMEPAPRWSKGTTEYGHEDGAFVIFVDFEPNTNIWEDCAIADGQSLAADNKPEPTSEPEPESAEVMLPATGILVEEGGVWVLDVVASGREYAGGRVITDGGSTDVRRIASVKKHAKKMLAGRGITVKGNFRTVQAGEQETAFSLNAKDNLVTLVRGAVYHVDILVPQSDLPEREIPSMEGIPGLDPVPEPEAEPTSEPEPDVSVLENARGAHFRDATGATTPVTHTPTEKPAAPTPEPTPAPAAKTPQTPPQTRKADKPRRPRAGESEVARCGRHTLTRRVDDRGVTLTVWEGGRMCITGESPRGAESMLWEHFAGQGYEVAPRGDGYRLNIA